jgi:PadR family transcriptional regulator, regulatory protein PadR
MKTSNRLDNLSQGRVGFYPKALMEDKTESGELIQGTLEMLILKALVGGPMHGYGVAEWIQQTSQQVLKVEEGALYPALHRLELRGVLKAEWGFSDNNRRAKFYRLTAQGKKRLNAESQRWTRLSAAVAFVMQSS